MTDSSTTTEVSPESIKSALYPQIFADTGEESLKTYAVLDGASIPDLMDHLYGEKPPVFVCLYRGELEPDMAEVAPYLVELKPNHPFTDWVLTQGWGKHWGIISRTKDGLKALRTHFRKFLMVKDPSDKQLYFRFYDPRVLRLFLPTCNAEELQVIFGGITGFICEGDQPAVLLTFTRVEGQLFTRKVPLLFQP